MSSNIVHIEILIHDNCMVSHEVIKNKCHMFLLNQETLQEGTMINNFHDCLKLSELVKAIFISHIEPDGVSKQIQLDSVPKFMFYVYQTHGSGPSSLDIDYNEQSKAAATSWCLPSSDFVGMWESLVFDDKIKHELMNYISTTLLFSEKNVDANIIPWNKIILLHGPPGTGKTSLCKALSQKISIQFQEKFTHGYLFEINCHSLFSKFFSESGKMVSTLFRTIEEYTQDEKVLVIILIDEVESLAHSRKAVFSGNSEPSDAIRVVNSLLTHLDHIKRYPNILILTTSNITEAIDLALIDRADIKKFIGLPSAAAIYQILHSCICELQRTGIIFTSEKLLSLQEMKCCASGDHIMAGSLRLKNMAEKCVGLSGRTIRKLPLLAHTRLVKDLVLFLEPFLDALEQTIEEQIYQADIQGVITKMKKL